MILRHRLFPDFPLLGRAVILHQIVRKLDPVHASPFQVTQPVDIVRDLGPARKFKLLTVFENRVSLWEFTPD
jgi:hypothetical protein